jgi:hypothetical protein
LGEQIKQNEVIGSCGKFGDRVLVGKPEGKRPLGNPRDNGSVILKWFFKKWDGGHGQNSSCSGQGQVGGAYDCDNEPFVSIKCGNFFTIW